MKAFSVSATLILLTSAIHLFAAEVPEPKVEPKVINPGPPPSDAIVLFDGKDLSKWQSAKGGEAQWDVKDGAMVVTKTGNIQTK